MRVVIVPGVVIGLILMLIVIVTVPEAEAGLSDWARITLADVLIALDVPVMTDGLGRFVSLL